MQILGIGGVIAHRYGLRGNQWERIQKLLPYGGALVQRPERLSDLGVVYALHSRLVGVHERVASNHRFCRWCLPVSAPGGYLTVTHSIYIVEPLTVDFVMREGL